MLAPERKGIEHLTTDQKGTGLDPVGVTERSSTHTELLFVLYTPTAKQDEINY